MHNRIDPRQTQGCQTSHAPEEHLENHKTPEKKNCKQTRISIYRNSYDTKGIQTTLDSIYKRITTGAKGVAKKTKKARKLATTQPTAYKQFKASNFIAPTFAGTFPKGKRQQQHLETHSGYIVLDIDDIQPLTLYALIAHLRSRDDITLAFLSPSGIGLKVIVPIHPIPENADEHKAAYQAVIKHFTPLAEKYQFTFDQSGSDCSRLCYLAHDRNAIYHPNATPICWDRQQHQQIQAQLTAQPPPADFDTADIDTTALDYVDPTDAYDNPNAYDTWYKIGIAIKSAGLPFEVWDTWSQKDPKYQENAPGEMLRKWESFTDTYAGNSIGWGTVVHYAKQNGYRPPRRTKAPLLQIDTTDVEKRKAALAAQSMVETQLTADIQKFIDAPKAATPQFTILPYETGSGKSTTTLIRAKAAAQRMIALLENHQLATEQTSLAASLGFTAKRFRGRGYNFENSKLAMLPVKMREQNETLFEKHNVTCPIYDVVEKTTDKRVSPLYNCLRCPLLSMCKKVGYWSQFAEILKADYLAVCMQDLMFNPDLWAFLNTLLSGKIPFEEKTDQSLEEIAMDAMLDLDTETHTPIAPFDFALIDDFQVSRLYTDVSYTIEELAVLMRAWHGTKTGEVIEKINLALWELYKHEKGDTAAAIKMLRDLFASLTPQTRDIVNENLTQHAHRTPEGDLEPISPFTALHRGVKLENLTPVWHSKSWTLLHQLEAMLAHCKNDSQAPIYHISTANIQKIVFTIPPQIHPQLNKILFLSATADIEATQAAFTGKTIDWTLGAAIPTKLAAGVRCYQYVDSRLTAGSIFEIERDSTGDIVYDDTHKPKRTGALTNRSGEILNQISRFTTASSEKSLFTSYKEFTTGALDTLPPVQQLRDAVDTITHYDIVSGRNFKDYKVFVIFGYPKIRLRSIQRTARRQYAHDPQPLSFEYEWVTIAENGYTSKARRFLDPRVEKVRQQLTTEKLKQAIGRARITRWENTIILCMTNEPIPGFTEFATPVTYKQLMQAQSFDDIDTPPPPPTLEFSEQIPDITEQILNLKAAHPKMTQSEIARQLGITQQCVSKGLSAKVTIYNRVTQFPLSTYSCKTAELYHVTLQNSHTLRGQILCDLQVHTQRKTAEIIDAVDGQHTAIKNELKRLLETHEIVKVKHGVYALPDNSQSTTAQPLPESKKLTVSDTLSEIPKPLSEVDNLTVSDTLSEIPKPRPPLPSKKPPPQETELEKPPPMRDPNIPKVREITDIILERTDTPSTDVDLYQTALTCQYILFCKDVKQCVEKAYPDLSQAEQERLIHTTETLIRQWIQQILTRMTFSERASLCIDFAKYKYAAYHGCDKSVRVTSGFELTPLPKWHNVSSGTET